MTGFCLAFARRVRALHQLDNQPALFRTTLETFVDATEKAVEDSESVRAYEEWFQADDEGPAVRAGVMGAAAVRWSDE